MDMTKVGLWIQAVTVASVLFGIGLVVWELRQQREFAETQHVSASMNQYSTSLQSAMGENVAASIAVACDSPDEMTTENMIVAMNYYGDVLSRIRRLYHVESVTSLQTYQWKTAAEGNFPIIFATEFGRWWWTQTGAEPEVQEYGNQIRDNLPDGFSCATYLALYKELSE